MIYVSVDVEADGPCPGVYSMIALGAVVIEPGLNRGFRAYMKPISSNWDPEALAVTGLTRDQTLGFPEPEHTIDTFLHWIDCELNGERLLFVSDNAGFDWQFVNYYLWRFAGRNPFGHSALSLTSLYKGYNQSLRANFRRDGLRITPHDHDPLDDAKGNAEVLLALLAQGLEG